MQVCQSAEDYQGYDGELGLCVCREPPGRVACGSLCRRRSGTELQLQCQANGEMELICSYDNRVKKERRLSRTIVQYIHAQKDVVRRCILSHHVFIVPAVKVQHKHLLCSGDLLTTNTVIVYVQVSGISGNVLETVFKRWDPRGTLRCNNHLNASYPVYIVQTTGGGTRKHTKRLCVAYAPRLSHLGLSFCLVTEAGFLGLLTGLPKMLQQMFPVTTEQQAQSSAGLTTQFLTQKSQK